MINQLLHYAICWIYCSVCRSTESERHTTCCIVTALLHSHLLFSFIQLVIFAILSTLSHVYSSLDFWFTQAFQSSIVSIYLSACSSPRGKAQYHKDEHLYRYKVWCSITAVGLPATSSTLRQQGRIIICATLGCWTDLVQGLKPAALQCIINRGLVIPQH